MREVLTIPYEDFLLIVLIQFERNLLSIVRAVLQLDINLRVEISNLNERHQRIWKNEKNFSSILHFYRWIFTEEFRYPS